MMEAEIFIPFLSFIQCFGSEWTADQGSWKYDISLCLTDSPRLQFPQSINFSTGDNPPHHHHHPVFFYHQLLPNILSSFLVHSLSILLESNKLFLLLTQAFLLSIRVSHFFIALTFTLIVSFFILYTIPSVSFARIF